MYVCMYVYILFCSTSHPNYVIAPSFSHPHTRSRLEKLMGSNIVRLTDRNYMQKLQDRICEERLQRQLRRIQERRVLKVVAGRSNKQIN